MLHSIKTLINKWWRPVRPIILLTIIFATVVLFVIFFRNNPEAVNQLKALSITTILLLIGLYGLMMAILALISDLTIRMCGTSLNYGENFLLTSYSSIANFFGPLQSGPGVRTAYLKKKHNLSIRTYLFATMLYYAIFAAVSGMFFVIGFMPWWACVLIAIAGTGLSIIALKIYTKKIGNPRLSLTGPLVAGFVLATFLQLVVVMIIYGVELHSLGYSLSIRQLMTYTGTANFAMFVSLTPGALGFREAFLLFTKQLTGLSNTAIITANLLDRVVYVIFLGGLFTILLGFHGFRQFKPSKSPATDPDPER